ncbi:hypothetical protein ACSX1A_16590 [Pontibacter sp. MBLB2868]|uniref:hypothetical protein n=1 Tax=Pontibacter sp. MBLB2868 TaxID=3451555 RepID=UPI003F75318A
MEVYFKNSFVAFYYDKQLRLGKAVWKGQLRGAELREAYLLVLDMIDRFYLTRWLGDDRLMESIDPDDLAWSMEVFVPRLAKSSLRRLARLPSQFMENRQAVDRMVREGQAGEVHLTFKDFGSEEEAVAWLMEPL